MFVAKAVELCRREMQARRQRKLTVLQANLWAAHSSLLLRGKVLLAQQDLSRKAFLTMFQHQDSAPDRRLVPHGCLMLKREEPNTRETPSKAFELRQIQA